MAMVAIRTCRPLKVSKALLLILAVWPGKLPILEPGQLRTAGQADQHDKVHAEATLGGKSGRGCATTAALQLSDPGDPVCPTSWAARQAPR